MSKALKETKKEEVKAVVATENSALVPSGGDWGGQQIDAEDILIPRILVMQGLSEFVAEEKAEMGDICNSVSSEKLGGKGKPVELIPLSFYKTWEIFETVDKKPEWRRSEPINPRNADLPLEEVVDGTTIRRDKTLNFYVMLASDLAKEDGAGAFPYVLSFRRYGYKEGRKLVNHFAMAQKLKAAPASKSFHLACRMEKNDKGSFYVFEIGEGRKTTPEELSRCYEWFKVISKGATKVDESSMKRDVGPVVVSDAELEKEVSY